LQRLPSGLAFRDDDAIGTREEPTGFRRNLRACNVLVSDDRTNAAGLE
jgi:hypothetical protein